MDLKISPPWLALLHGQFQAPYFESLMHFVQQEFQMHHCFPPAGKIFNAFAHCPPEAIKVVIIGQDPYHGAGQANGLCFSVADGVRKPPSLQNILKELVADVGVEMPESGNLEAWAAQGVLLLNATLTVRESQAGSHQKQGWEQFTDAVIEKLGSEYKNVVYLLWGSFAQKKAAIIDPKKNLVLKNVHPSPLSAHRGFFGTKHFSQANQYLKSKGKKPIDWSL